MKKIFFILTLILILFPFISSEIEVRTDGIIGVDLIPPIPESLFYDATFNGGWEANGVSILGGDIYA